MSASHSLVVATESSDDADMPTDALSQILTALKKRGVIYFHTNFTPPWSVAVPAYARVARFHMAIRGHGWVRVEGEEQAIELSTGDLVVVPHGGAHVMSDEPDLEPISLDEVLSRCGYNGSGALAYGGPDCGQATQLFCGHFEFDEGAVHPLLTALPGSIHIPNTESMNTAWLDPVIRFVASEVMGGRAGADAIVHRLTEIIFIQVVRSFVDQAGDAAGCLAGVLDRHLGRALSAVHEAPEQPWTVETMARESGLSRTVFADRFHRLIGMTPLAYVTQWRMHVARRHLLDTDLPMVEIAEAAGYRSESAFARAFRREFGVAPGTLRRERI